MSDHGKRQPIPGVRRSVTDEFETRTFAKRREKNRVRNKLAKAARRKNR